MRPELSPGLASPSANVACPIRPSASCHFDTGAANSPWSTGRGRFSTTACSATAHYGRTASWKSKPRLPFARLKSRSQGSRNDIFDSLPHRPRCGGHTRPDRSIAFCPRGAHADVVQSLVYQHSQTHCPPSARNKLGSVSVLSMSLATVRPDRAGEPVQYLRASSGSGSGLFEGCSLCSKLKCLLQLDFKSSAISAKSSVPVLRRTQSTPWLDDMESQYPGPEDIIRAVERPEVLHTVVVGDQLLSDSVNEPVVSTSRRRTLPWFSARMVESSGPLWLSTAFA